MSDTGSVNPTSGASLSPRNTDTLVYRVLKALPVDGIAPVGGTFTAWAQGEVFACVSGVGLGPVKNSDIAGWLDSGMIICETPLTPAQERALTVERLAAVRRGPETPSASPAASSAIPWAFPDTEGSGV